MFVAWSIEVGYKNSEVYALNDLPKVFYSWSGIMY